MSGVTDLQSRRRKLFSDFADEPPILDGAKTRIEDVINTEIEILAGRVTPSKYSKNASGMCLTLQFVDPASGERKVVFTGSDVLISQYKKYEQELPFVVTIKKVDRYYLMT